MPLDSDKKEAPSLNPALKEFWLAKRAPDGLPVRNRILYGGRSSSKTWDIGGFAVYLACNFQLRFLCTRQLQNRIDESVHALLKIQIARFGLDDQFSVTANKIENLRTGTVFVFYGIRHHIKQIKGFEGADVLWIEEGEDLTKDQWETLEPTIRKQGSQVWMGFNPNIVSDFSYTYFVQSPPPGTIIRKINYDENPYLSQTMLAVIKAAKARDYDDYVHVYLGEPLTDDDSVIIKRSWILSAVDAHKRLRRPATGRKRLGFDVADSGADKCATIYVHGWVAFGGDLWQGKEDELMKSCKRVWADARQLGAHVTYDSIGVGAGCGSKFQELNEGVFDGKLQYSAFNAGGSVWKPDAIYEHGVKNEDHFHNIKAQQWWLLADRFRNTHSLMEAIRLGEPLPKFSDDELISIDSAIPNRTQLINELSTPNKEFSATGKIKVESKEQLADRGIASPNCADAFLMAFCQQDAPMRVSSSAVDQMRMRKTR